MQELLNNIIPNVMAKLPDFYAAIGDTLLMVVWSGASRSCRADAGRTDHRHQAGRHSGEQGCLSGSGESGQPVPFHPVHYPADMGNAGFPCDYGYGNLCSGAIVPLVFGAVPFFTRQVESALAELNGGLIEAALSMGSTPLEIIFRVYLKESVAAIARGTTITAISLLNLTAMAGVLRRRWCGQLRYPLRPRPQTCWTLPTSLCWSSSSLFVLWSSLAARSSRRTRIKECLT